MASTNAEKQAAWRKRREKRRAELEAWVAHDPIGLARALVTRRDYAEEVARCITTLLNLDPPAIRKCRKAPRRRR
jgi:hypothetical protein